MVKLFAVTTAFLVGTVHAVERKTAADTPAFEVNVVYRLFNPAEVEKILSLSPIREPPKDETNAVAGNLQAAHFGQFLFFDKRLSANGQVSCASCHQPEHGFSSPDPLAEGIDRSPRHPPSLLNVAYQRWFDWDGKADSLWAQAVRPLESPREQGITRTEIARLIVKDSSLRRAYEAIFGSMPDLIDQARFPVKARPFPENPAFPYHRTWLAIPVDPYHQNWLAMRREDREIVNRIFTNVTKAIAAYVMQQVAIDAPFDRYVEGFREGDTDKLAAISPSARRGLKLFIGKARCILCHNGPNFTDRTFHNLGLGNRPWLAAEDQGRYYGVAWAKKNPFSAIGDYSDDRNGEKAKQLYYLVRTPEDRGQFKTPSLRNVELTPPYMHGGHFETLEAVIRFYSKLDERPSIGQRDAVLKPLSLTNGEILDLVAFLKTLTGQPIDKALTRQPASPLLPD